MQDVDPGQDVFFAGRLSPSDFCHSHDSVIETNALSDDCSSNRCNPTRAHAHLAKRACYSASAAQFQAQMRLRSVPTLPLFVQGQFAPKITKRERLTELRVFPVVSMSSIPKIVFPPLRRGLLLIHSQRIGFVSREGLYATSLPDFF
jgi:hypothetical protein